MGKRHLHLTLLPLLVLLSVFFFSSTGGSLTAARAIEHSEDQDEKGIVSLQSVKEFKRVSRDYDFVYMIVTAERESDDALRKTVLAAAQSTDKKAQIGLFEINKRTDGYKRLVRQYKVEKFPAVVAMNGEGEVEVIQGEISQKKLLEAHAKVSGAKKKFHCPVSQGKPCDPKACGKEKDK
jgi:hypothetical protein